MALARKQSGQGASHTGTVTPLNPPVTRQTLHDVQEAVAVVKAEIRRLEMEGVTLKKIAALTDLHVNTVSRFSYGEPKRPHALTLFKLFQAFGWTIIVEKR